MPRILLAAISFLLLLVSLACGGTASSVRPTTVANPGSTTNAATSEPSVTATPVQQASPTEPGGTRFLTIGGQRAVTVAVSDPAQAAGYATTQDVLYRTDDGVSWSEIGVWDPLQSLLVDPAKPNVLYSGGHPGCAIGGPSINLRKSSDGGRTWQSVPAGQNVRPLIVDPANHQVIYGERCALTISVDGGQSWTDYPMALSFDVSAMVLAGKTLYVLATSEGGTSRIRAVDVSDPAKPDVGTDLREFWGGGTIVATPERIVVGEPHGIDISSDGGKIWSFSRAGLESVTVSVNPLVEPVPNEELSRKFGIFSLAVTPGNPSRIFAGTIRGLYRSDDGGSSWTRVPAIDEVEVSALAFGQNGALLYVTTSDGVVVLPNP